MRRALLAIAIILPLVSLGAQDVEERLAFEVASVRPNTTDDGVSTWSTRLGRFLATNVTLRSYVVNAYELAPFQVEGGPPWVDSMTFDISARTGDGTRTDQQMPMLRALLADRFKLVAHVETREEDVFALVSAAGDGSAGVGLVPTLDDCDAIRRARLADGSSQVDRPMCGENVSRQAGSNAYTLTAGGLTMAELARILIPYTGRPVLDRTGLTGRFDIDLQFGPTSPRTAASVLDAAPTLVTAVEEQLGLKLEPGRGPVEYLVIDSAERPEPN